MLQKHNYLKQYMYTQFDRIYSFGVQKEYVLNFILLNEDLARRNLYNFTFIFINKDLLYIWFHIFWSILILISFKLAEKFQKN